MVNCKNCEKELQQGEQVFQVKYGYLGKNVGIFFAERDLYLYPTEYYCEACSSRIGLDN